MSEVTNIRLQYPPASGITNITIRRPKVRDMLASDKAKGSDAEKEIALFSNLCELAPANIEELDLVDYRALQTAYQGFLS